MTTTRQLQYDAHGAPGDVLRLGTAPLPAPGPGAVRVRLTARPINPSDILTIRGQYGRLPTLPAVPGLEGAGVIDALGPGVTGWAVGQRVVPLTRAGTWADHVLVPANHLIEVPDAVPDTAACQLLVNPFTAWLLLFEELGARHGDTVVQSAAGSAVGRAAIQLAANRGIHLINIVRRHESVRRLEELGARNIIATEDAHWAARIPELAGGTAPRLALDGVSGPIGAKLAGALGEDARMIVYGVLSMQPLIVDPRRLIFQNLHVRGFWLAHWLAKSGPDAIAAIGIPLLNMMADGALVMPVAEQFDLADYAAALAAAYERRSEGKVILTG
jgi:NADPH:quinone reductase-like Zn-dependent oxidoreductase